MATETNGGPGGEPLRARLEQCHEAAFSWALSCCRGDRAEAEDALQATYLKVLDGTARYAGRSAFTTWLFAVIRKTAAGQRRSARLHRLLLMRDAAMAVEPERPAEPPENIEQSRIAQKFRQALYALPRRQREMMTLAFTHDLTLQESATVLAISLGSARKHYERGKQQLHRLLADLETHDGT
jgi:RNA polymerase sigma-70 factor (ECF subfamily)